MLEDAAAGFSNPVPVTLVRFNKLPVKPLTLIPLKWALMTALTVWVVVSLVSTVEESRATWLLLGMVGAAGRVNREMPRQCERCFPSAPGGTSKVLNPASAASLGG